FAFTLGQRLVRMALRAGDRLRLPHAKTTIMLAVVLTGGAVTEAIHVHLVLGTFVAGILIARSPGRDRAGRETIHSAGMALFVPFFFAYTGIKVDLTTLTGPALVTAVAAIAVAVVAKGA